ncbi:MAG: phosphotransferase [Candidatus Saccharibacteria bacterium]|nr:phosphotransferase [Candidatus Saccharibacteria bacterium]
MKELDIDQLCRELQAVSQKLNLGQGEYQVVRLGNAWVFKNPTNKLIARIHIRDDDPVKINQQLKLYTQLVECGYPIIKPLLNEVATLKNQQLVSFWPLGQDNLTNLTSRTFVKLLTACHQVQPQQDLTTWQTDAPKTKRLLQLDQAAKAGADQEILKRLESMFQKSQAELENYYQNQSFDKVIIHGDFYHGNIIKLDEHFKLCDLDYLSLGPKERDLATVYIDCHRYLKTNFWAEIIDNYPLAYDAKLLKYLIKVQEIGDCIFTAGLWGINPTSHQEVRQRLKHWHQEDFKWTDF